MVSKELVRKQLQKKLKKYIDKLIKMGMDLLNLKNSVLLLLVMTLSHLNKY